MIGKSIGFDTLMLDTTTDRLGSYHMFAPALYEMSQTIFFQVPFSDPDMTEFENLLVSVFAMVLLVILLGSLYAFVRAIFQFIFSRGEEANIKKAGDNVRYIIIGLIFVTAVLLIIPTILGILDIPGSDVLTLDSIFTRIGEIISTIFLVTGSIGTTIRGSSGSL